MLPPCLAPSLFQHCLPSFSLGSGSLSVTALETKYTTQPCVVLSHHLPTSVCVAVLSLVLDHCVRLRPATSLYGTF